MQYIIAYVHAMAHMRLHANSIKLIITGAHEPPKAAKERVTPVPCKYKFVL